MPESHRTRLASGRTSLRGPHLAPSTEARSAGTLARYVEPVSPDSSVLVVRDRFSANSRLHAMPVIDRKDTLVGLFNRFHFLERLARSVEHSTSFNRPASVYMQSKPLIVDEHTELDRLEELVLGRRHTAFEAFIVSRDGRYYGIGSGIDLMRAMADRRHAELLHLAHHDDLTGLANRYEFEHQLHEALTSHGDESSSCTALLFIDVDRFKQVNDTFGHRIGDLVLRAVGRRLCHYVRSSDVVARLSGDEFAIILRHVSDAAAAEAVASGILSACSTPLPIEGREIVMSCSIGIALAPLDATTPDGLVHAADAAVYHAKHVRNSCQRYQPDSAGSERAPALSFTSLRQLIERGELAVHYQPQINLKTGCVSGVEALLRSEDTQHNALRTDEIVRLAEDSGLIVGISEWVIRTAMDDILSWRDVSANAELHLAVNISGVQIGAGGLLAMLDRLSTETGFESRRLELELTESAAMQGSSATLTTLQSLRERGYLLAIDDFGTGYSSMSLLERLPVDILKIDRSFVGGLGRRSRRGSIAKAIIALGHSLRLRVIGEGIETATQLRLLRQEGCDIGQGYYLGMPMPAAELRKWLRDPPARRQSRRARVTGRSHAAGR